MSNVPFFEINGNRYEIKRNRYIQAEFDEMKRGVEMTSEEETAYIREQEFNDRLEKLRARKDELYAKYLETFAEEDEKLYRKACIAFDKLISEASGVESIEVKQRNKLVNMGEKLIIKALTLDSEGRVVMSNDEAKTIWETFVEENGQRVSIEFIVFTLNYIMGSDNDVENPFIAQAKAKAEQRANMRKGIAKAR
jgi:hypothetical protein